MTKAELLNDMSQKNNGVLKIADALQLGISKTYFLEYVNKNNYEKISYGVYLSPDAWEDGMYLLQLRFPKIVYSYETALYLLDLIDREPLVYDATVYRGYNPSWIIKAGVKAHSVSKEHYEIGITGLKTPMGNTVNAYNAERTICDILKPHSTVEIQDRQAAMKEYVRRKDRDIPLLMEYAKVFRVDKTLQKYLEVLL